MPQTSDADRIDAIQRRTIAAFARAGVVGEVDRNADDPIDTAINCADGTQYGLGNLTLLCLAHARWRWGRLIRTHVAGIVAAIADETPVDLRDPEVRSTLRSRLMAVEAMPVVPSYARAVAPGMIELLCLDLPTTVTTVADDSVVGHDIDALFSLARAQLQFERFDRTVDGESGLVQLDGASFFTASHVLDPGFVARESSGGRGIVFLAPDRHRLFLAPVTGPDALQPISLLVGIALRLEPGELAGGLVSNIVYFHDGTSLEAVDVELDAKDHALRIQPGERLLAALG